MALDVQCCLPPVDSLSVAGSVFEGLLRSVHGAGMSAPLRLESGVDGSLVLNREYFFIVR